MRLCSAFFLLATSAIAQPSIESRMLAAHNAVREPLKLPRLTWSDKLAARALDWAQTLTEWNQFFHRPQNTYGENLYAVFRGEATPEKVVEDWAAEVEDYDYRANTCTKKCGHYTQIVWKGTRKVGCGVSRRPGREVWVCNYDPPGNYVGQRPY